MWQVLGIMLMLFGVFNKFGAFITLIPDPIVGTLVRCSDLVGFYLVISIMKKNAF